MQKRHKKAKNKAERELKLKHGERGAESGNPNAQEPE